MKLRNKETGEIENIIEIVNIDDRLFARIETISDGQTYKKEITSLAELNEEWEDYKELEYWYIDSNGVIIFSDLDGDKLWEDLAKERKQIGNYFETKEQAEKAVEKLKAWKRLKDKGFKFTGWNTNLGELYFKVPETFFPNDNSITDETWKDLDLLFRGEE